MFQTAVHGTALDVAMLLSASFAIGLESDEDDLSGMRMYDVNDRDLEFQSPLLLACGAGKIEVVRMLLDAGAAVNDKDLEGNSPLLLACGAGKLEVARMLVDAGADVNFKDVEGNSPLLLTCGAGELEVAEMLVDAGADVCGGNDSGDTPLFASLQAGSLELVTMLLDKGANVDDERKDGAGLLGMAILSQRQDMLCFVLRRARKRLELQDSMSTCQFFESLAEAFLDPVKIKRWLDGPVSPSVLVGELGALVSCCTLDFSVKERLEDVRAFISLNQDILQDPSRWPVKHTFEQLVSQEPDTVFGNKTGDDETAGGYRIIERVGTPGRGWAHHPCRCTYVAQSSVSSVCYSPDGSKLARAEGKLVVVCDASTGFVQKTLRGHKDYVLTVNFAPDGKTIVSGSRDKSVRLWDSQSGKLLRTLTGTRCGPVWSVVFSPDGTKLLSGSSDKAVRVWATQSGEEKMILKGHTNVVSSVVFSPDGATIASGSWDHTVRVWDAATALCKLTIEGHGSQVNGVSFLSDGKVIVSCSGEPFSSDGDNSIRLWSLESGEEIRTLKGHGSAVLAACFSPDGETIVSVSADETIREWERKTGKEVRTLRGHGSPVSSVSFSPDGQYLITGSMDKTVRVWSKDKSTASGQLALAGHGGAVTKVEFIDDAIVSSSDDGTTRVWKLTAGGQMGEFEEGLTSSKDRCTQQTVGKYVVTVNDDLLLVSVRAELNAPTEEGGDHDQDGRCQDKASEECVAFFRAPNVITTLQCVGERIAVGCENGEVLELRALWLYSRPQSPSRTYETHAPKEAVPHCKSEDHVYNAEQVHRADCVELVSSLIYQQPFPE